MNSLLLFALIFLLLVALASLPPAYFIIKAAWSHPPSLIWWALFLSIIWVVAASTGIYFLITYYEPIASLLR